MTTVRWWTLVLTAPTASLPRGLGWRFVRTNRSGDFAAGYVDKPRRVNMWHQCHGGPMSFIRA